MTGFRTLYPLVQPGWLRNLPAWRRGPAASVSAGRLAPAHRHSQSALRFVLDGSGAHTTVDGNLFLAGDAAHIVPPTGARSLNLAIADVALLANACNAHYNGRTSAFLDSYPGRCLARVWKAERFSWYLSQLLHQFPDHSPFEKRMQQAEFDYIASSESASRAIADNYVGLPLDIPDGF